MSPASTFEARRRVRDEASRQVLAWELTRAHGHVMRSVDGLRIGRLAWLRYGRDDRWPVWLMVRPTGWRALVSFRERSIPFELVEGVDHCRRTVTVAASGAWWAVEAEDA